MCETNIYIVVNAAQDKIDPNERIICTQKSASE